MLQASVFFQTTVAGSPTLETKDLGGTKPQEFLPTRMSLLIPPPLSLLCKSFNAQLKSYGTASTEPSQFSIKKHSALLPTPTVIGTHHLHIVLL